MGMCSITVQIIVILYWICQDVAASGEPQLLVRQRDTKIEVNADPSAAMEVANDPPHSRSQSALAQVKIQPRESDPPGSPEYFSTTGRNATGLLILHFKSPSAKLRTCARRPTSIHESREYEIHQAEPCPPRSRNQTLI